MGTNTASVSQAMMPYGGSGMLPYNYNPGLQIHPGSYLLPPVELSKYSSLPDSIRGQIMDDSEYDIFGKAGLFFDDGSLDRPTESALMDYREWLRANPEIEKELDAAIEDRLKKIRGEDPKDESVVNTNE